MARILAIICFVLATLSVGTANAQDREKAKAHFQQGTALYEAGDYEGALAEFQQGKEHLDDPSFDYSIAACWWRLGDLDAAEEHASAAAAVFEEYGRAEPAALNEARLAAFRRLRIVNEVAESVPPEPVVEVENVDEPPRTTGTPALVWVGAATAAVGVGLLGWWTVEELGLGQTIDDYEAAAAANDSESWSTLRDEIESTQQRAKILLFSGAGLAAIGGGLLVWGLASSSSDSTVAVRLNPTGVVLVHRF